MGYLEAVKQRNPDMSFLLADGDLPKEISFTLLTDTYAATCLSYCYLFIVWSSVL